MIQASLSLLCNLLPKRVSAICFLLSSFRGPTYTNKYPLRFVGDLSIACLIIPKGKRANHEVLAIAAVLGRSVACNGTKPSSPITSKQDRRKGILQDSRDQQQWCNLKLKAMATKSQLWSTMVNYHLPKPP